MIDITLFEQLDYLLNRIASSPIIIVLLFLMIIIGSLLLAYKRKHQNKIKYLIFGAIAISILLLLLKYHKPFLELTDGFIENLIMYIYFPNIVIYTLIVMFSNISFILNIKSNIVKRVAASFNAVSIDFIFFVLLGEIANKNIDIYQEITIDSQKELLIILQLTTEIFFLYVIVMILIYFISKLYNLRNLLTREIIDFNTLEKDFN